MQALTNKIMKPLFFIFLFLNSRCCYPEFSINNIPQPTAWVNDYAHLLSRSEINQINSQLDAFTKKTGNQIAVAIFPGNIPGAIEDFSSNLEEQWKIGEKGKDNGLLLVIFPTAHQLRIEVGYGLEEKIPDTIANSIISNTITPFFKQEQYALGIEAGIQAMMKAIDGAYVPAAQHKVHDDVQDIPLPVVSALVSFGGFFLGFGIGPLLALILCISFLGFEGAMIWLGAFNIYALIYHLTPQQYQFTNPLRFLLGGFNGLISKMARSGSSGNDSSGGSSSGSSFGGGGGGSSGGGGASGRW